MRLSKFLASFGGIGLIPLAPGTWGSLAGVILVYILGAYASNIAWLWCLATIIFFLGWYVAKLELQSTVFENDKFDPSYIVIDEVAGVITAIAIVGSVMSLSVYDLTWIFCLFRFFDILKPFPIGWVDQILCEKRNTAPLGIMLDDILAGICAAIIFLLWSYIPIIF